MNDHEDEFFYVNYYAALYLDPNQFVFTDHTVHKHRYNAAQQNVLINTHFVFLVNI